MDALEQVLAIEARMALEGVRILDQEPAAGLRPLVAGAGAPFHPFARRHPHRFP